jgi:hypothetical protein
VLGARELELGKFLALGRAAAGLAGRASYGSAGLNLRVPHFLGVELRLAEAVEVAGYGFVIVESEVFGIGADEALVEDAAREAIEILLFDGAQHARADLGCTGNVFERNALPFALCTEFVAELAHQDSVAAKWPSRAITES